jgi:hypothetical protein
MPHLQIDFETSTNVFLQLARFTLMPGLRTANFSSAAVPLAVRAAWTSCGESISSKDTIQAQGSLLRGPSSDTRHGVFGLTSSSLKTPNFGKKVCLLVSCFSAKF